MNTCVLPETVNYHFTPACNMQCRFCFSGFSECGKGSLKKHKAIIHALAEAPLNEDEGRLRRLNFVGGEPTVIPYLEDLLLEAKACGLRTSMVTNGFNLVASGLPPVFQTLDLLGLSIDSLDHETNLRMGRTVRGQTISASEWMELFEQSGNWCLPVKINTTVTGYNAHEDLSHFIVEAAPHRWKVFHGMLVAGQNDYNHNEWTTDTKTFDLFVRRHEIAGASPVVEQEQLMRGSYAMISPDGRFFDSTGGFHAYSESILDVGIDKAWEQVGFDSELFRERTISYGKVASHE